MKYPMIVSRAFPFYTGVIRNSTRYGVYKRKVGYPRKLKNWASVWTHGARYKKAAAKSLFSVAIFITRAGIIVFKIFTITLIPELVFLLYILICCKFWLSNLGLSHYLFRLRFPTRSNLSSHAPSALTAPTVVYTFGYLRTTVYLCSSW